jgi:hypothetical protein
MAFARDRNIPLTFEMCDRIRDMMRAQGPGFDRPKALALIPAPPPLEPAAPREQEEENILGFAS